MKIAVMGSGGVGGYFGAKLARAGADVTFIARGRHREAMSREGLQVQSALGDFHLQSVNVTDKPAEIGIADVVLFTVKSWDSLDAARAIEPLVGSRTAVISLQNGVENDAVIRSALPEAHVLGGVCYISSYISRPGVILHSGTLQKLIFGDEDGRCSELANDFLNQCRSAGFEAEIDREIERAVWEKFVFLVGLSATTAASRLPIGRIRSHPESRRLLLEVMEEAAAVARAKGIRMDPAYAENRLPFCDSIPADFTSSMHKDLERGGRLEVDWLSGSVVRLGEPLGVPTPVNRVISRILAPHAAGAQ